MEHGGLKRREFMREIVEMTRHIVAQAKNYESDTIPGDFATLSTPCPKCGGEVHEKYRKFQCMACDFGFWKIMGGRQLEPAEAETLLSKREVGPLDGFRSRIGRPFSAKLRLTDANEVEFDFGPRPDADDGPPPDFSNPRQMAIDQFCGQEIALPQQQGGAENNQPLKQSDFDCKNSGNAQGGTEVVSATGTSGQAEDVNADFDEATRNLQCDGIITITPNSISTLTLQAKTLGEVLSPYALWILPALYGALGGIMFHMRMILNPLLPNPPLSRLIHRIALGGLAGMILAWFMAPGTKLGGEVTGIGFSLFTFAFLFGFSLDIFFAVLDQFVSMSVAAIKKFGSPTVA